MTKRVTIVLVLFAATSTVVAGLAAADKPRAEAPAGKPFEGKALWVTTNESGPGLPHLFLEDPQQKRVGDRWFLVGKDLASPGGVVWWPVERILSIREFATCEEMAKVVKIPGQPKAAAPGRRGSGYVGSYSGLLGNGSVQKELKLNEGQVNQVKEAIRKVDEKRPEPFGPFRLGLSEKELREKMEEMTRARTAEILRAVSGILTADQVRRLKQIELQHELHFSNPRVFERPDVQQSLHLTPNQQEKIKAINEDAAKQYRELWRGPFGSREGAREKVLTFRKETIDKINAVLTNKQKETLKELSGEPFEVSP